jgi:hypothetical protein
MAMRIMTTPRTTSMASIRAVAGRAGEMTPTICPLPSPERRPARNSKDASGAKKYANGRCLRSWRIAGGQRCG